MTTPETLSRRQRFALFMPVAIAIVALDLGSKAYIFEAAEARIERGRVVAAKVIPIIPGLFDLECVMNPGAFSGWFGGWPWFLIAVSAAALVAIAAYLWHGGHANRLFVLALACIAGGTAGNLYDRCVYSAVRDFLHFFLKREEGRPFSWPNFNVADASICLGVGLWLFCEFRQGKRKS